MMWLMKEKNDVKILYLMNVDWAWIAQRPHFLAIELGKYFDLTVVYLKQYIKRWKSQRTVIQTNKEAHGIYFPKQEHIKVLEKLSDWSFQRAMGNLDKYDIIWVGDPLYFKLIKNYNGKIIYDCMDNNAAFADTKKRELEIQRAEQALFQRADYIFCSSLFLKNLIVNKIDATKISLLRNGFCYSNVRPVKKAKIKPKYKLGYIGTISSWMDFDILRAALDNYENIEIHMIGPKAEQIKKEYHERLFFDGVVEHNDLYKKIEDYDCLIMTFHVNEITLAVDPVKLYEYISFGKCILSVYYEEIKRFENMVYFYHNTQEFLDQIKMLSEIGFPASYNENMQKNFLNQNSWELRGTTVRDIIYEFNK